MKQECYSLMVFTNEIIYSLLSAMTVYAWSLIGRLPIAKIVFTWSTLSTKLSLNSIKNETGHTQRIARDIARN